MSNGRSGRHHPVWNPGNRTDGKRTSTDWIVDAMLETGATGNPRSPMSQVIHVANQLHVRRMAIDLPTGLDCDTGIPSEATFRADVTCTFIGQKIGFANSKATEYLGTVKVVGIGAPVGEQPSIG